MKIRLPGVNPKNPYTITSEHHEHMAKRQKERRVNGMTMSEKWFIDKIAPLTGHKWTHEARWGFRLFDFWNSNLGLAVEIDGPEHDASLDSFRDKKEWERSRILIFRIRNENKEDAARFLEFIKSCQSWNERRLKDSFKPVRGGDLADRN